MSRSLRRHLLVRSGILLVAAILVYIWRPLFHPVFYDMLNSPGSFLFWSITLLGGLYFWFKPPINVGETRTSSILGMLFEEDAGEIGSSAALKLTLFGFILVVAFVVAGLYAAPANQFEERTLAQQTMGDADSIDSLPSMNEENARIVPRPVSDVQTRGSVSYRQYRLGTSDIARMEDGRLAWSYAIQPDGFRNMLFENQQGVLLSDMTRMEDREIRAVDDSPFEVGEGMFLHRGSTWNLRKTDFWAQYRDDAVEFVHDGEPYMAYPKTGHEWQLTPIPHTTPTWDGVALVHPDGTIDHLSPDEARESEILDGQRLYPLYNTKRQMNSLSYREGIINQFEVVGSHVGEVEIAGLPAGAGNDQPFVIDLEGEQMSYVTAMEPYGADTRGLDEVWFMNAETGKPMFFESEGQTLTGPERAMGIVRSADSRTGWGDNFVVVEPIPVIVDDQLWWHSKVVPTDNTDITRNVFVNSESGEAVSLESTETVRAFLGGEDVADAENVSTDPAPDEEDILYYLVIESADGEVIERVPVRPGEDPSVNFVPADEVEQNATEADDDS